MPLGTTTAAGILAPEEVGPSVVQPLRLRSAALRTATVIETVHPSMRFPIVVSDAAAELVEESAFIPETDADVTELNIVPVAFKALPTVSNELVADSATNAQAAAMIGDGLVRQSPARSTSHSRAGPPHRFPPERYRSTGWSISQPPEPERWCCHRERSTASTCSPTRSAKSKAILLKSSSDIPRAARYCSNVGLGVAPSNLSSRMSARAK